MLSGAFHHCYVSLTFVVVVVNIFVVVVVVFVVLFCCCFGRILLIVIFFCVWQSISVTFQMGLLLNRNEHYIKN